MFGIDNYEREIIEINPGYYKLKPNKVHLQTIKHLDFHKLYFGHLNTKA